MSTRVEVEAKYFLKEDKDFFELIKNEGFTKIDEVHEEDIYFTDLKSEYIKNRTCLRIRKNEKEKMELTFKGKSNINQEFYIKKENNILVDIKEYNELIGMLNNLGYYIYVTVSKNRIIYSKREKDLIYNIMIDNILNVGNFVEFEILCNDETESFEILKNKLNDFVDKFNKNKNMEVASLPYRDFVALAYYQKITNKTDKKTLLLDFDQTSVKSEKEFFKDITNIELLKQLKEKEYCIFITSTTGKEFINEAIKNFNLENTIQYIKAKENTDYIRIDTNKFSELALILLNNRL